MKLSSGDINQSEAPRHHSAASYIKAKLKCSFNSSLNQWNGISPIAARTQLWHTDITIDTIILLLSADAAQQARDGACWWRLGDLRELPAETRPLPHAPNLPGGGQDIPHQQQQVSQHQGPHPRQLPGGGGPLPQQKVRTRDWKVALINLKEDDFLSLFTTEQMWLCNISLFSCSTLV